MCRYLSSGIVRDMIHAMKATTSQQGVLVRNHITALGSAPAVAHARMTAYCACVAAFGLT